ncbi:MAG: MarR family transcriptional regulator [Archaeoglobaceae archaeon]
MRAENKIFSQLELVKEKGILQSEIAKTLNLSKSTVSDILSELEEKKLIVREEISQKSYRVWLAKYYPGAIEGMVRVGILKASEYGKVVYAGEKVGAIFKVYKNALEATKDLVHGVTDIVASPFITQAFFRSFNEEFKNLQSRCDERKRSCFLERKKVWLLGVFDNGEDTEEISESERLK